MKLINLILFLILVTSVLALPPAFEKTGLPKPVNLDSSSNNVVSKSVSVPQEKTEVIPKYVTQEQFNELKLLIEEKYAPSSNGFLYSLLSFIGIISLAGLVTSSYAVKGKKKGEYHEEQFQELVIYFRSHQFQGKNALAGVAMRAGWNMKQVDEALKEAGIQ